jgi:sec-independent protein translocase protein TatA
MDFTSPMHLILILAVFMLLFGGKKIPELMRGLGQGVREFKKATEDIKSEINNSTSDIKKELDDAKDNLNKTVNS